MSERYKHWDYYASTVIMWVVMYTLTIQMVAAFSRGQDCVTFREIGIFILTFMIALAATGWNVHVVDKYRAKESEQTHNAIPDQHP